MRFGSVDMFMEFGEWDFRMGRPIANEGFLRALLKYGTYDEYEFFCPDYAHMTKFSEKVMGLIPDVSLRSRVKASLHVCLSDSLRLKRYDAFHLGDFTRYMPYLAGIRNLWAKHPFPITGVTHSLDGVFLNLRYLELLVAGLAPFDSIICTSESAKKVVEKGFDWVKRQTRDMYHIDLNTDVRMEKIPLGIEETFFGNYDKKSAKAYFNIPEEMVVALSVGRLSLRQKADWSPVLETLARMYSRGDAENLLLIIAGGGSESDISLLESLISRLDLEQRVLLFPNFLPEVKESLYKAADIYLSIIDNFQETFGLNVVEAMASGLPVIVSDFDGYRDLVKEGENGFLIPTVWSKDIPEFLMENLGILDPSVEGLYFSQMVAADLAKLDHSIKVLYSDINLRRSMGLRGCRLAQSYRWHEIIRQYETLWADLGKEAGRPDREWHKPGLNLLVGNPADTFSHYPSRTLAGTDFVTLTDIGRGVMEGSNCPTRYEDIEAPIFQELERIVLEDLSQGSRSVETIKQRASEILGATEGQTEFHILWLLKHGAISLESLGDERYSGSHSIFVSQHGKD